MFSHPVSMAGYAATIVGLLLVLFSMGAAYDSAFTMYMGGTGLTGLGAFMILLGVIAGGIESIKALLRAQLDFARERHREAQASQTNALMGSQPVPHAKPKDLQKAIDALISKA